MLVLSASLYEPCRDVQTRSRHFEAERTAAGRVDAPLQLVSCISNIVSCPQRDPRGMMRALPSWVPAAAGGGCKCTNRRTTFMDFRGGRADQVACRCGRPFRRLEGKDLSLPGVWVTRLFAYAIAEPVYVAGQLLM